MSNQTLYAFVIDWNSGTYVSQFFGNDANSTIIAWADSRLLLTSHTPVCVDI